MIDKIVRELFEAEWYGEGTLSSLDEMKKQLRKTLRDQSVGRWSGHTSYHIAVDGGFIINGKKGEKKRLTSLGEIFVEEYDGRK